MADLVLSGATSGSVTLSAPAVSGSTTLTLPTTSGTVLTNASSVAASQLPVGSVVQVVSVTKTNTFTSTQLGSDITITGMAATITPSSSSNKILVMVNMAMHNSTGASNWNYIKVFRDATQIAYQYSSVVQANMSFSGYFPTPYVPTMFSFHYLDSPATTASTTYQIKARISDGTFGVNTSTVFNDGAVSSITVMEIKA